MKSSYTPDQLLARARGILLSHDLQSAARIRKACKTILQFSTDAALRHTASETLCDLAEEGAIR